MTFAFGQSEKERIEIEVIGYERAPVGEYFDDNWLTINVQVQVGSFHGKIRAAILTGELEKFLSELQLLFTNLTGIAKFETLEQQLGLLLTGDGKGHIELEGEIEAGHRLIFKLNLDQSELGLSIRQLEEVMVIYPVRLTGETK